MDNSWGGQRISGGRERRLGRVCHRHGRARANMDNHTTTVGQSWVRNHTLHASTATQETLHQQQPRTQPCQDLPNSSPALAGGTLYSLAVESAAFLRALCTWFEGGWGRPYFQMLSLCTGLSWSTSSAPDWNTNDVLKFELWLSGSVVEVEWDCTPGAEHFSRHVLGNDP